MQLSLDNNIDERKDERILQALADRHCISILIAIRNEPKSVLQISRECKIFLGSVYRRIKLLQECGFIDAYYEIKPDGKRFVLYQSKVDDITASFDGNQTLVNVNHIIT